MPTVTHSADWLVVNPATSWLTRTTDSLTWLFVQLASASGIPLMKLFVVVSSLICWQLPRGIRAMLPPLNFNFTPRRLPSWTIHRSGRHQLSIVNVSINSNWVLAVRNDWYFSHYLAFYSTNLIFVGPCIGVQINFFSQSVKHLRTTSGLKVASVLGRNKQPNYIVQSPSHPVGMDSRWLGINFTALSRCF